MSPKTYFIKTFGCQMNTSDSERIAGFLRAQGYKLAKNEKEADLIVINACSVRQSAIDRVYSQVNRHAKNKKIILAGCVLEKDLKKMLPKVSEFWHPDKYFGCRPIYQSRPIGYIPIMTGCNNFCSYCVVPYTRGQEKSHSTGQIISEVKSLVKKGYQEIMLLGQNVNSYCYVSLQSREAGEAIPLFKAINYEIAASPAKRDPRNDNTINFPLLLNYLAMTYPQITFRFLTSYPKDFSYDLIKVIARNKNISREIHLPVQSGSDKILKAMNRPYTQKKYLNLIQKICQKIPKVIFTTDVIVGFPGETKKDFQKTVKVFKKVGYHEAYINKYSPRPGTAAWKLGNPIPLEEKKRREKILRESIIKNGRNK